LAELIRIQHALATTESPELVDRERELIQEQGPLWFGPLAPLLVRGELDVRWHLGFVEAARLRRWGRASTTDLSQAFRQLIELPIVSLARELSLEGALGQGALAVESLCQARQPACLEHLFLEDEEGGGTRLRSEDARLKRWFPRYGLRPPLSQRHAAAYLEWLTVGPGSESRVGDRTPLPLEHETVFGEHCRRLTSSAGAAQGAPQFGVERVEGRWRLRRFAQAETLHINGFEVRSAERRLNDGDWLSPAPGLVLKFCLRSG